MARRGKKYRSVKKSQPKEILALEKALEKVSSLSYSKFKGSVELHLALKLPKDKDPKSLKGSISLPHSSKVKETRVAVFTNKENEKLAKAAGADIFDMEELTKDVKAGKVNFDVLIATPDVMPQIASLGKVLGPKGLMPNPKTGTVTEDFEEAVKEYKKGKISFKSDDSGVMHFRVGSVDQPVAELKENTLACVNAAAEVLGKKADQVVRVAHIAPTMGPSIKVVFEAE